MMRDVVHLKVYLPTDFSNSHGTSVIYEQGNCNHWLGFCLVKRLHFYCKGRIHVMCTMIAFLCPTFLSPIDLMRSVSSTILCNFVMDLNGYADYVGSETVIVQIVG